MGDKGSTDLLLDSKQQDAFVAWYRKQDKDDSVVRFFDRKGAQGCYTVHGADAGFVARTFCKTTAVVKQWGTGAAQLPAVQLNRSQFESVLREVLLDTAERSVELWEGHGTSWTLSRSASPGKLNAFSDELFVHSELADQPVVAAVSVATVDGGRRVGVAYVDAATRWCGGCSFHDDEHFCTLESFLVQLGVKECVVPKESDGSPVGVDVRRVMEEVLPRVSCLPAVRPRAAFSAKNLQQDLGRLVRSGNVEQHRDLLDDPHTAAALSAVLAFAELTADDANHGRYSAAQYDLGRHMRLDSAAQTALNVFPQRSDATSSFSLFGLMARGRTAMSKRLLKVWLKQPLVRLEEITQRHDIVEALATDAELRETLRDQHFRGMPDVDRLTRKLARQKVSLAELCQLYRASSKLPLIEASLRGHSGPHAALLRDRFAAPLADAHSEDRLTRFEELLEAAVDLDRIPDEYLVAASYNPRLEELKAEREEVEAEIAASASAIASDLGLVLDKTIKLEWHKANNVRTRCMRITQKEEKVVRKKLQAKYTVLETRKDGTKFLDKRFKQAAGRLQHLTGEYAAVQKALVEQVVGVAHTFTEVWEPVAALLGELDVLAGLADLAVSSPSPYVRPTMLGPEQGELVLRGSRHPCLEAQGGGSIIPNDCDMKRGDSWFQLVTGPNMGGKSTYIRQVGAVVLMAQVGSFVPCASARIAVRDCIYARVGAGDCQLRGVSTFMAEMLETAAILKGATERSLVIIDELGRGTSTYDGFGLAWAISEHLMQSIGCPTLFATHFHELTSITGPGGVANRHVATSVDPASGRLTMLYNVVPGPCDQSFGIEVAEFANFPKEVVAAARTKLAELEGGAAGAGLDRVVCGEKRRADATGVGALGPSAKRRLSSFAREFAALPMDTLSPEEGSARVKAMMKSLKADAADDPALLAAIDAGPAR